jgi:hypothetical protein
MLSLDYYHVTVTLALEHVKRAIMSNDDEFASETMNFESVLQTNVPKGRDGKHKEIVTQLLSDIAQLGPGAALKIPLSKLPDTKQNVRSALSRAASQKMINLATSSNDEFLYVWKTD